jgi:hypothetical protein
MSSGKAQIVTMSKRTGILCQDRNFIIKGKEETDEQYFSGICYKYRCQPFNCIEDVLISNERCQKIMD